MVTKFICKEFSWVTQPFKLYVVHGSSRILRDFQPETWFLFENRAILSRVKPSDPQGAKAYYLVSVAWSDKLRNTTTPLGWDSSPMQLTPPPPPSFPTPLPPAFCQAFLAVCRNPWTILGERGRARGKCLAQEYNTMTGKVSNLWYILTLSPLCELTDFSLPLLLNPLHFNICIHILHTDLSSLLW